MICYVLKSSDDEWCIFFWYPRRFAWCGLVNISDQKSCVASAALNCNQEATDSKPPPGDWAPYISHIYIIWLLCVFLYLYIFLFFLSFIFLSVYIYIYVYMYIYMYIYIWMSTDLSIGLSLYDTTETSPRPEEMRLRPLAGQPGSPLYACSNGLLATAGHWFITSGGQRKAEPKTTWYQRGGFHSHGATPIGWFISWKILLQIDNLE